MEKIIQEFRKPPFGERSLGCGTIHVCFSSRVRKPYSELALDDLLLLRDAAFNLLALPIRLNRLRNSLMLALTDTDLYSSELLGELRQHLGSQLSVAARIGQEVFRCRGSNLAVPATTTAAGDTERPKSTTVAEAVEEDEDIFDF